MIKILGVDRLDYTKGIDLKLEAFEQFLYDNPNFVGKVQFLQSPFQVEQMFLSMLIWSEKLKAR